MKLSPKFRDGAELIICLLLPPIFAVPNLVIFVIYDNVELDLLTAYTILLLSAIMGILIYIAGVLLAIRDRLPKPLKKVFSPKEY